MRIASIGASVLMIALAAPLAALAAGSGSSGGSMSTPRQMTPEEEAKAAYNQGVRAVKQADKLDHAAHEATDDKKKTKAQERAHKQYANARGYFVAAVQRKPKMHEAWNYVGYTSRKLGEYNDALAAYDEALRLNPSFGEAIEYRGEAYLALNRIDDAKGAYMALFKDSRALADQLMAAMQRWVGERRTDAAGVSPPDLDAFAQWIDERAGIARQTASLAIDRAQVRWN